MNDPGASSPGLVRDSSAAAHDTSFAARLHAPRVLGRGSMLAAVLCVATMSLAACGSDSNPPADGDNSSASESAEQSDQSSTAIGSLQGDSGSGSDEQASSDATSEMTSQDSASSSADETASTTADSNSDSTTEVSDSTTVEDSTTETTDSTTDDVDPNVDKAKVVVHIQDNLDMAKLQEYAGRYDAISRDLWVASEGQQYVETLIIRDNSPDSGDNTVFISTGDIDTSGQSNPWCPGGALACVNWYRSDGPVMYVGGDIPSAVWGHEHGHSEFWMWEEYDEPQCHDCFMAVPAMAKYCDNSYHVLGAQDHEKDDWEGSCWDIITKYYHPEWERPVTGFDPNSTPPAFKLTIEDN